MCDLCAGLIAFRLHDNRKTKVKSVQKDDRKPYCAVAVTSDYLAMGEDPCESGRIAARHWAKLAGAAFTPRASGTLSRSAGTCTSPWLLTHKAEAPLCKLTPL